MAQTHSKKDIRKAIKYAESRGWTLKLSHGHAYGHLRCGGSCFVAFWSTPRSPHMHAKSIIRSVDNCRCFAADSDMTIDDEPTEDVTDDSKKESGDH